MTSDSVPYPVNPCTNAEDYLMDNPDNSCCRGLIGVDLGRLCVIMTAVPG